MSSSSNIETFDFNRSSLKKWSIWMMGVGGLCLLLGGIIYGGGDEHGSTRFWATLLYNSVFILLVVNSLMFFICACTLAMGGWFVAFRRLPEAISATVPIMGLLTLCILLIIVFSHQHHIYHWLDADAVAEDKVLEGKSSFLNSGFYVVFSVVTVLLWSILGKKMRALSTKLDKSPLKNLAEKKRYIVTNTVWASLFIVLFGLTVGSTLPWLWIMSIDAHWFSTMYSWYTLISSFVAGMCLIALLFIYLKRKGLLALSTREHLHDIGKFIFAFSIFWTYLWFSQFMLIWYANIPEETVYFSERFLGTYRVIFFANLIINFFAPLLILMSRGSKRNYNLICIMSIILFLGHWLDFYQMVIPSLSPDHILLGWFDLGILIGFLGLVAYIAGRYLSKHSLAPIHHPFIKESAIHHT